MAPKCPSWLKYSSPILKVAVSSRIIVGQFQQFGRKEKLISKHHVSLKNSLKGNEIRHMTKIINYLKVKCTLNILATLNIVTRVLCTLNSVARVGVTLNIVTRVVSTLNIVAYG